MLNSFKLFSYTTVCLIFKWIEPLFFELSCTQTDTHTDPTHRQTDRHECSIVFNRNYNKAYTCLCFSKSNAIERIKNAKCESSLRCLTWRKPTQEIFGKERHKPDAGKKRLVGARLKRKLLRENLVLDKWKNQFASLWSGNTLETTEFDNVFLTRVQENLRKTIICRQHDNSVWIKLSVIMKFAKLWTIPN